MDLVEGVWLLFLFLLLLSYIIAPIRESANILNPFILKFYNNLCNLFEWYEIDIETNFSRGCTTSPSSNSSRRISINSVTLSIDYMDWVQVQANNMT